MAGFCHFQSPLFLLALSVAGVSASSGAFALVGQEQISDKCSDSLKRYLLCNTISSLYSICHADGLFNSSAQVRAVLGCKDDSSRCTERCLAEVARLTNQSVHEPCSADYQAMHGFSAPLNIFTIGQIDQATNATKATMIPLPNVKNMGGPTLLSYGEPGHCAEIPTAQYCILSGQLHTGGRFPMTFALGSCLPSSCAPSELGAIAQGAGGLGGGTAAMNISVQCDLVRPLGPAMGASAVLEDKLGWGGVPVYYPKSLDLTLGAMGTLLLILALALLVVAGTWVDLGRESKALAAVRGGGGDGRGLAAAAALGREAALPLTMGSAPSTEVPPMTPVQAFFNHWSLLRNGRSLLRTRPRETNDFACLDAIRVFSMAQVILGHTYVYVMNSAGFANMEQFSPPFGLLGSFWFQIVPGCFYGVDSFFVMSGFLCAVGLQKRVFNREENRTPGGFSVKYLQFALQRWLRLIPAEMFVMALLVTVLPYLGTGILWNMDRPDGHHCYDAAGAGQCSKTWWVNMLFLQNLDKYTGKCMGHTWYLANDFQLYLTAPFFALAYGIDRRLGWALLSIGLVVGVTIPVVMTAQHEWVPEIIAGATKGFDSKFYMKPWCRCPAFLIGIAAGWAWPSLQRFKGRPETARGSAVSAGLSLLGVGLCLVATFGRMAFFQCDLASCSNPDTSPVPRYLQYLWAALSIPAWCLGLAIIMTLCFLRRFQPLAQGFMHLSLWQPVAKLSYSAYLIHTAVLILDFCQRSSPVTYSAASFAFGFVAFTMYTLLAAFCVYILVEKPASNLQMKLLGAGGD